MPIWWDNDFGDYISPAQIPSILHVNKESRSIGLRYYQLRFAARKLPPSRESQAFVSESVAELVEMSEAKIFFSFDRDIAYFGLVSDSSTMAEFIISAYGPDVRQIQRLGINISIMKDLCINGTNWKPNVLKILLRLMDNIKEVILVDECVHRAIASGDFHFVDPKILMRGGFRNMETTRPFDLRNGVDALVTEVAAVSLWRKRGWPGYPVPLPEDPMTLSRREKEEAVNDARLLVSIRYLLTCHGEWSSWWKGLFSITGRHLTKKWGRLGSRQVNLDWEFD